ncbi:MAG: hypothetical protein PHQ23_10495 [Candidatus Wallbacteria bacterium]|nr:hypothetical protein [Candidatus Wallbacteria bacterium]
MQYNICKAQAGDRSGMDREQFRKQLSAFFEANCKRKNYSFSGFEELETCLLSKLKWVLYSLPSSRAWLFRSAYQCHDPHRVLFPEVVHKLIQAENTLQSQNRSIVQMAQTDGYVTAIMARHLIDLARAENRALRTRRTVPLDGQGASAQEKIRGRPGVRRQNEPGPEPVAPEVDETAMIQAEEFRDFFVNRAGLSDSELFSMCVNECTGCTVFIDSRKTGADRQERKREINTLQQCYKRARARLASDARDLREYYSNEALELFLQLLLPELCRQKFGDTHLEKPCS